LDRRLDGLQDRSGRCGEKKNLALPEIEPGNKCMANSNKNITNTSAKTFHWSRLLLEMLSLN
jgi:hypothetical protein